MFGIDDKKITICFHKSEDGEVRCTLKKSLFEFVEWLERAKARGAKVFPNGVNGCIVVLKSGRYFDVELG